jgi:AcrR family transcriptional regulator
MARPVSISDDAILAAAREVFLAHGVRGTTAEVAARAGVSEGSVFKRWKTKEALFRAAMRSGSIDDVAWMNGLGARVGQGDLREQLIEIGLEGAEFFYKIVPLHMHSFAGRHDEHENTFDDDVEPAPLKSRKRMASYLEAERRLGRIRGVDPDVMARAFMGAIYNFVALELMLGSHDPHPMPASTFVRGLVDLLLRGAGHAAPGETRGAPAAPSTRPSPRPPSPSKRAR